MKNFCKNFLKNNIYDQILSNVSLFCLLNKQELNFLYFYLIKNNGWNIKYIKSPTEEMKLFAIKKK